MKTTSIATALVLSSVFAASASFAGVMQYGERATGLTAPTAASSGLTREQVVAEYNQAKSWGMLQQISNGGNEKPFAHAKKDQSTLTRADVLAELKAVEPAPRLHF